MKDVKKLMAVMSVLVMAAVFSACGSSNDSTTAGATGEESQPVSGEFAPVADAPEAYSIVGGEAELERSGGGTAGSRTGCSGSGVSQSLQLISSLT